MNERISELINQAARQYEQEVGLETFKVYYTRAMEIFAELIVRECAVIVGSMEEPHQDIAKLVKRHFGVE